MSDDHLRSLVDRIVNRESEKHEAAEDIKEIYAEAKSAGYNVKALRLVVKRALESDDKRVKREVVEQEAELLEAALGVLRDTPLGAAAISASSPVAAHA